MTLLAQIKTAIADKTNPEDLEPLLFQAVANKDLSSAEMLIDYGVDINVLMIYNSERTSPEKKFSMQLLSKRKASPVWPQVPATDLSDPVVADVERLIKSHCSKFSKTSSDAIARVRKQTYVWSLLPKSRIPKPESDLNLHAAINARNFRINSYKAEIDSLISSMSNDKRLEMLLVEAYLDEELEAVDKLIAYGTSLTELRALTKHAAIFKYRPDWHIDWVNEIVKVTPSYANAIDAQRAVKASGNEISERQVRSL